MASIIFNFFKAHYLNVAIIGGIAAIFATISLQHVEINRLKNRLQICNGENISLQSANRNLASSIERQNNAIEAVKAAEELKSRQAEIAAKKARKDANSYYNKAQTIISTKSSGNNCVDILSLLKTIN